MPSTNFSQETLNDLSDYFHGAPIGLKVTGPDGTITRTNLAELRMLGYDDKMDEYVGRHVAEFHSDPDAVQEVLDRLVGGESVTEHEATLLRRDGTPQKILMYANARIDDGEFRGMRCFTFPHPDDLRPDIAEVGALNDLSVENRGLDMTPEQQDEMYTELSDFFENSPVNLHIVGGDGLIKHASKSELGSLGYDRDAYVGQHIARFHADQSVIDGMLEDLVGGTPLVNFGATLYHKDGTRLPVMIYSNSRMRDGSFVNTRCFTVPVPKARMAQRDRGVEFAWPRNEDFGFTIPGRAAPGGPVNPMTLALKYIASRKRPEESLGFLARVSQVFASVQPLETALAEVAVLCVPFLADVMSVDRPSRHLAHASTADLQDRAAAILRVFAAGGADAPLDPAAVHAAGTAQCWDDPNQNGEGGRGVRLRTLGIRSAIMAPLTIRGAPAGTLTLLRGADPSRRNFGPADRALAEEVARRISVAIEIEDLSAR